MTTREGSKAWTIPNSKENDLSLKLLLARVRFNSTAFPPAGVMTAVAASEPEVVVAAVRDVAALPERQEETAAEPEEEALPDPWAVPGESEPETASESAAELGFGGCVEVAIRAGNAYDESTRVCGALFPK